MNMRFTRFFLVAILAFASLMPMFAQTVAAQSVDGFQGRVVFINQFNRRVSIFNNVALRASDVIGNTRIMFLLSAQLGVPVTILNHEFAASGLGIEVFAASQILSRTAGVPSVFVIDLVNSGRNFGQIALQLNVQPRLAFLRLNGLMNVFVDEVNVVLGVNRRVETDFALELNEALDLFSRRFSLFVNVLGESAFNAVLLNRLSFETGLSLDALISMRADMATFSGDQFALFVLLDNSFNSALNIALARNDGAIITPGGIFGILRDSDIPISLFLNRALVFMRAVDNEVDG